MIVEYRGLEALATRKVYEEKGKGERVSTSDVSMIIPIGRGLTYVLVDATQFAVAEINFVSFIQIRGKLFQQ